MSNPVAICLPRHLRASIARSHPTKRRATGFTMVEILTVLAIISILVGLLFAAMKYARNSAATSRTKAQLDTLRGMLGELDAANALSQSPAAWPWFNATVASLHLIVKNSDSFQNSSGYSAADFWKYPNSPGNGPTVPPNWDPLDAPGDVGNDSVGQQSIQRNASFAVVNTQLAMQLLAAVPGNKAAIDNLPANSKMMTAWQSGAPLLATQTNAGSPNFTGLLKENGTDGLITIGGTSTSVYVQGSHVSYQGRFYLCTQSPTTNVNVPGAGTAWIDESAAPHGVPVLLDGWGNPIIFVPATGLHVKLLNGQGSYLPADPPAGTQTQEYIIISPEGSVSGNGGSNPAVTRPGRPFFASAGPDGDFTKGDDNLYSFNN